VGILNRKSLKNLVSMELSVKKWVFGHKIIVIEPETGILDLTRALKKA
jgi:hypothetical protein